MFLVWAATWDHTDVQGLCRAGPAPHWLQHTGELAPCLIRGNTLEGRPYTFIVHTVELALVA